jgi:hypothetical protein
MSGGAEQLSAVYWNAGLYPGGQRWGPPVEGYVSVNAAARLVDRSWATVSDMVKRGQVETIEVQDRHLVSLASLNRVFTSGETAHVTFEYRDGIIVTSVSEPMGVCGHAVVTDSAPRGGMERDGRYKQGVKP